MFYLHSLSVFVKLCSLPHTAKVLHNCYERFLYACSDSFSISTGSRLGYFGINKCRSCPIEKKKRPELVPAFIVFGSDCYISDCLHGPIVK